GNIDSCRRAFKGGALDFLRKPVDDDELIGVVQQAIRKRRQQGDGNDDQQVRAERIATLSTREREVFDGIVSGLSNKE
ncbi:response regulator transcription factor, partial [Klebsiella pneumoniae]|uniref:response regulator transcription factor n=2 Tax=Pseudomonadota TaxID=1224 RepID=UPI002ED76D7D|nr:DNA-binding response regulator [Klebsiella pneumoniae]